MTTLNFKEWKDYLVSQDIKESEILDICASFLLTANDVFNKDVWTLETRTEAEKWVSDICDSISCSYGDLGSFLKLHYLDYAKFADAYTEYLTDDGNVIAVYCSSTDMVLIFKEN